MADQPPPQQPPDEPVDLQVETSRSNARPARKDSAGSADSAGVDDERAHQLLTRLLRVAYPHESFPDGPYERTATAVLDAAKDDPAGQRALNLGLEGLDRGAGGDFLSLDNEAVESLLRDRADDDFFRRIRSTAVVALYDDEQVWGVLGYEGSAYEQGGYLHRGFDDMDWLPPARIEEYDGEPRDELVITEGEQG